MEIKITDKFEAMHLLSRDNKTIDVRGGSAIATISIKSKLYAGFDDIKRVFKMAVDELDHSTICDMNGKSALSRDQYKFIKSNSERVHVCVYNTDNTAKVFADLIKHKFVTYLERLKNRESVGQTQFEFSITSTDGGDTSFTTSPITVKAYI